MDKYIINLVSLCNKYHYYNQDYVFKNYNILNIHDFDTYYEENKMSYIIFHSHESELLFIHCFNFDSSFIEKTYSKDIYALYYLFFIDKEPLFFNQCHEINNVNYTHLSLGCSCVIKVKSIVKLKISALIHIYKANPKFNHFNFDITKIINDKQFKNAYHKIKMINKTFLNNSSPNIQYYSNPPMLQPIEKNILLETLNFDSIMKENMTNASDISTNKPNNIINLKSEKIKSEKLKSENLKSENLKSESSKSESSNSESSKSEESKTENSIIIIKQPDFLKNKNISNDEILKNKEKNITKMLMLLKK